MAATAMSAPIGLCAAASRMTGTGKPSPIKLGLASYTFRNFSRAQMIGYMKQLDVSELNAKDVKDHLPTEPMQEMQAIADYTAAGIKAHAAGAVYFLKDEDDDIRVAVAARRPEARQKHGPANRLLHRCRPHRARRH
jgi:hypothetical protein